MFEKIRGLSDPTIFQDQEKEPEKELTPQEKKELKIIEDNIQKIEIKKQELIKKRDELLAKGIGNYDLEEAKELIQDYQAIKKENEKLIRQKDKILGIYENEECEELKFEVQKNYFEKETREYIANKKISSICSFNNFVFAGRKDGSFTLYQADKERKKMKIVSENIPEFLLLDIMADSRIINSKITKDYLAIAGCRIGCCNGLEIYSKTSENPEDWFKNKIDLSAKFDECLGKILGLDLSPEGLVGAGSWRNEVLVYNLKNNQEILHRVFPSLDFGYIGTFKFIPQTDYAVIAGGRGIKIINYKNGKIKWENSEEYIDRMVAFSPDKKEIAFTKWSQTKEVFFLDISDIENLSKNQEVREEKILNENGNPIKLSGNRYIHYTPDKKYLVIGTEVKSTNILIVINRKTMKIVKKFNFGREAIVDQKGNIIDVDSIGAQLIYID